MANLNEEKIDKVYESLKHLTKLFDDGRYFPANRVYWHGKGDNYESGIWNEIDEPSKKETKDSLELLVEKIKALK